MPDGMLIWLILFAVFGACFFAIAAYVSVTGVADVKALLNGKIDSGEPTDPPN